MTIHKINLIIVSFMLLVAVIPQVVSAQFIIDRITVQDKTNENGSVIGKLISLYTSVPTTSRIDYGLNDKYGLFNGSSLLSNYHEIVLVSLKSNTTYHYRITVYTNDGQEKSTADQTFKTSKIADTYDNNLLVVSNVRVTNVGGTYFIVTWSAEQAPDGQVQYSTVEKFTKPSIAKGTRTGINYEAVVSKLKLNTKYYWRIYIKDKDGNTGSSSVQTITTAAIDKGAKEPLIISEVSPLSQDDLRVTDTTAVVRWQTNLPSKATVTYKSSSKGVKGGSVKEIIYATDHDVVLTNLKAKTPYSFIISAKDVYGKTLSTGQFGFSTKATSISSNSINCPNGATVWVYGQCRNLSAERGKALELKQNLNKKFSNQVPAAALHNWYTLVNAYTYGGYPLEAIVAAIRHGGKTVHPTIPYSAWQNSKDYKNYIKK